jgi:hypothetical protein
MLDGLDRPEMPAPRPETSAMAIDGIPHRNASLGGWMALLVLCTLSPPPAQAIVIRHDVPDSIYVALARGYPEVANVGWVGNGTLVASQWVLTAAHVADQMSPFCHEVRFGDRAFEVDSIRFHPRAFLGLDAWVDFALLRLTKPVAGIKPVALCHDGDTVGAEVTIVGSGMTGDGHAGPRDSDGILRAARSRIVRRDDRILEIDFDSTGVVPLAGLSGPGDSGGPVFIEGAGTRFIAAVSSRAESPDDRPKGTYGTRDRDPRVIPQAAWLDSVMHGAPAPGTDWSPARRLRRASDWPRTKSAACVRAYLAAFARGDSANLERFVRAWGDSTYLATTPAQRAARLRKNLEQVGTLTPYGLAERADGTIALLLWSTTMQRWLEYHFHFVSSPVRRALHGIERIAIAPAERWAVQP